MGYYADSSFLVSCYVLDSNTTRTKAWLAQTGAALLFTALHALEVRNAFQLGIFRGLLSAAEARAALANLQNDLQSGRLVKTAVSWPVAFRLGMRFSQRQSAIIGTRSFDILHVAAATGLRVQP